MNSEGMGCLLLLLVFLLIGVAEGIKHELGDIDHDLQVLAAAVRR